MVRQFLFASGMAFSALAFAATPHQKAEKPQIVDQLEAVTPSIKDIPSVRLDLKNRKLVGEPMRKAPAAEIHWKRPAGHFWGTGYSPEMERWYSFTPLVLRPWTEYTFENISTGVSGAPLWDIEVLANAQTGKYENVTSNDKDVSMSYLRYESCAAPRLSYGKAVPFPTLFHSKQQLDTPNNKVCIAADDNIRGVFGADMVVSSHFYSLFCLNDANYLQGITRIDGLDGYPGMEKESGQALGTNANGWNAVATRFEKPDAPYLLNSVHWFYISSGAIPKNVPLQAYVFKTANDAAAYQFADGTPAEGAELGELIAYSESFIPASEEGVQGTVQFNFKERNPVTGAESDISLEIDDDIIIMVTGYDVDLGNGQYVTSLISLSSFDEGYGNLGFIGNFAINESGNIDYALLANKEMFGFPTVPGVLAEVSYPWLMPYYKDQADDELLPNDGETTDDVQGLDYYLFLVSTSMTDDFDITYNGEEECDWLEVTDVYDEMEEDEFGEEVFSGYCGLCFSAAPNPTDENRTCKVQITIPAASYEITFRQGSNNNAVEIVGVDGNAQYFDLAGRRVANPDKGVYIKKAGNKAEKVLF